MRELRVLLWNEVCLSSLYGAQTASICTNLVPHTANAGLCTFCKKPEGSAIETFGGKEGSLVQFSFFYYRFTKIAPPCPTRSRP
jgi:hypothetical protein